MTTMLSDTKNNSCAQLQYVLEVQSDESLSSGVEELAQLLEQVTDF